MIYKPAGAQHFLGDLVLDIFTLIIKMNKLTGVSWNAEQDRKGIDMGGRIAFKSLLLFGREGLRNKWLDRCS